LCVKTIWLKTTWALFILDASKSYSSVFETAFSYPLRVWIEDGKEAAGRGLAQGDYVLVYQTKFGPARRLADKTGTKHKSPLVQGKQGIITIAQASGPLAKDPTFEKFEYANGSQRWWCWHAPLTPVHTNGYVSRSEVNEVLGYAPAYRFRGFGTLSSGLKEISHEAGLALVNLYLKSGHNS
jgi:hypothetical protein